MPETYHLWREFPSAPFYRWAAEVTQDDAAPDGYQTVRHDPIVADTAFWHRLSNAMHQGVDAFVMVEESKRVVHQRERREPGAPDFFEHAIRRVQGCILGQPPERMQALNERSTA